MPDLKRIIRRLTHMSLDEMRIRSEQEMCKYIDLALYSLHLQHHRNVFLRDAREARGMFFFSANELVERTELVRKHLSAEVNDLLAEADEILKHRFHLLGYNNIDYGSEIDWHLDAVHGKRAPLEPWFKINFLDFAEVGDHKVTWELNRHQHLVTLAKAWRFTLDDRYINELIREWHGWQAANPYPIGINWSSSLEVAFRSLSWIWIYHLLADCERLPSGFRTDLISALALSARHIERYNSAYFSPNTHLLGEATALFFIGTLCPQLKSAQRWQSIGWRILEKEVQRQVYPDGMYFEQSLYYHVYALDFLLHVRVLSARNQFDVPVAFDMVLEKMLNVLLAVSQTGVPDAFGDDDGGRVFNPRRNRSEHLTDPLALGAALLGRDDYKRAGILTEESLWLFGETAVSALTNKSLTTPKLVSTSFEAGGIYVMASSDVYEGQLVIDAGPQGSGKSGHGHADALSVRVSVDGHRWLVDSGTFSYMSSERSNLRGTAAHNTLRVDCCDQAMPDGPFAWRSIPTVRAEEWIQGETFSLFIGSHDGYKRLTDPVVHRRFAFHLHGAFWLVRDVVDGSQSHLLETFWHFASGLKVIQEGALFIAVRSKTTREESEMRLGLLPVEDAAWSAALSLGTISPAYGKKESAPLVRSSAHVLLPAEHATLLRPSLFSNAEFGRFIRMSAPESSVHGYRYDEYGDSHFMIFANAETKSWTACAVVSDARFIYYCIREGKLTHLILCRGSFAEFKGRSVVTLGRQIERFEWCSLDDLEEIYTSNEEVKNSFSRNAVVAFG